MEASRSKESGQVADVELNVRKAYWGAKLARELLSMLDEGLDYLNDAQKKIEEELADGSGNASVADRLRLRTMRADIEARSLEARRGADLAKAGLRALIGPGAPADLDVDDAPLEELDVPARELTDTAIWRAPTAPRSRRLIRWSRPSAPWLTWNGAVSILIWC